jgi:deoxyadenosine/deoxycytidine kinase
MNDNLPKILVLDGHDATGKTTLAQSLASSINGTYVRPYIEPYGQELLLAAEAHDYDQVMKISSQAFKNVIMKTSLSKPLIFDRLWITVFTLVPESYHSLWTVRPPTIICWTDLNTTLTRLASRKEVVPQTEWHKYYIDLYKNLAKKYKCEVIETTNMDESKSLNFLADWAKRYL